MGKDDKGHRVTIIVAIIGLVGILGAAMIGVIPILIERCDRPEEPKQKIVGKDGVPMVLIPAGDSRGLHHDAFYMDKYEVTNAVYRKFMDATSHEAPWYWDDPKFDDPGHPVVGVSWNDAVAYCKWAEKRLPTEGEWEYAARGGLVGKEYPWGDEITHDDANYKGTGGKDKWEYTAPVGSFKPNGYGLYDMAGNVSEWCDDYYAPHDPGYRVLCGGGWSYAAGDLRVASRGIGVPHEVHYRHVGFRCAGQ